MQKQRNVFFAVLGLILVARVWSVSIEENTTSPKGIDGCLKIETPAATYYYKNSGGGFASIIDKDGKDWVGHSSSSKSEGNWRGIPQANDIKFRPQFSDATTTVESESSDKIVISSSTDKGECTWTFYPSHVTWNVTQASDNYTLSYEGAPYDDFDANDVYYVTSSDAKTSIGSAPGKGEIEGTSGQGEWAYFGHESTSRALLFINHEDDNVDDYVGSLDHMTVCGFGRSGGGTDYEFTQTPRSFSIGFMESASESQAAEYAEKAINEESWFTSAIQHRKAMNSSTQESFSLSMIERIEVFDVSGKLVTTLTKSQLGGSSDLRQILHRGITASRSGLYLLQVKTDRGILHRRIMLK